MSSRTATLVLAVVALMLVAGTSASWAELSSGSGSSGSRLLDEQRSRRWLVKESNLGSARGLERMMMAQGGSQRQCSVNRPCRDGKTCCRNGCRNVARDAANCGKCYHVCAQGQSCCNGACKNLKSDTYNCGGCGRVCASHTSCDKGMCGYST